MKKFLLLGALTLAGVSEIGCTAAERQEVKVYAADAVAKVRSGALMLRGALAEVRANGAKIEDALALAQKLFPQGSDLSNLDAEGQQLVHTIQTSSDQQLLEQAASKLIAKYKSGQ